MAGGVADAANHVFAFADELLRRGYTVDQVVHHYGYERDCLSARTNSERSAFSTRRRTSMSGWAYDWIAQLDRTLPEIRFLSGVAKPPPGN